jgi:ankyrin repeat protein
MRIAKWIVILMFAAAGMLVVGCQKKAATPPAPVAPAPTAVAPAPTGDIHAAAAAGNVALVESLVSANPALVRAASENGRTPLHDAAAEGRTAVIKLLLSRGALVNARDRDRATPLYWAAIRGQAEAVRMLVRAGAGVNVANDRGDTPLHAAAGAGQAEVVRALLDAKASLAVKNKSGSTPLQMARAFGRAEVAGILARGTSAPAWLRAWVQRETRRPGVERIEVRSDTVVVVRLRSSAVSPQVGAEMQFAAASLWFAAPPGYAPKAPFEVQVMVEGALKGTARAWRDHTEWQPQ